MMTKSLTFVVLAALMLAVVGCAGDPPQQKSGEALVTPSDSGPIYGPWVVPIRFMD